MRYGIRGGACVSSVGFVFHSRFFLSRVAGGSEKAETPRCAHSNVDDIEFRQALSNADIKVSFFFLFRCVFLKRGLCAPREQNRAHGRRIRGLVSKGVTLRGDFIFTGKEVRE